MGLISNKYSFLYNTPLFPPHSIFILSWSWHTWQSSCPGCLWSIKIHLKIAVGSYFQHPISITKYVGSTLYRHVCGSKQSVFQVCQSQERIRPTWWKCVRGRAGRVEEFPVTALTQISFSRAWTVQLMVQLCCHKQMRCHVWGCAIVPHSLGFFKCNQYFWSCDVMYILQ